MVRVELMVDLGRQIPWIERARDCADMVQLGSVARSGDGQKLHDVRTYTALPAHRDLIVYERSEPNLVVGVRELVLPVVERVQVRMGKVAATHRCRR